MPALSPVPLGTRGVRSWIAVSAARVTSWATRLSGRHGTALPGLVASRIDPAILARLGRDLGPVVLVGGTNGKTTTTRLIAQILATSSDRRPVSNRSGANLIQGIVSAILADPEAVAGRPAVFETDELAFPRAAAALRPSVVVLLNLVRDQLDRFGEVDAVERSWIDALGSLPSSTRLVICADDPRLEAIARASGLTTVRFGLIASRSNAGSGPADAPVAGGNGVSAPCPGCGEPTTVEDATVSAGAWTCEACGFTRPPLDLGVRRDGMNDGWLQLHFELRPHLTAVPDRVGTGNARVRLTGSAGAHDAAAAILAATSLGVPAGAAIAAMDGATPAFGRLEEIRVRGRRVVLTLTKNPASVAQAAEAVAVRRPDHVVVGLGDRHADGRDVSWIWDAALDRLADLAPLTLTGTRADDLAVRFKYAVSSGGRLPDRPVVIHSIEAALSEGLARVAPGGTLMVLGTYTALLGIRAILERDGLAVAMPR
jgi:UDP-N-acetylmuramyl tripeptide synthase